MISKTLRFAVLKRDGFKCSYCGVGADSTELQVDHVIPKALGGMDIIANLRTACRDCNIGKGATPLVPDSPSAARDLQIAIRPIKRAQIEESNIYFGATTGAEDQAPEFGYYINRLTDLTDKYFSNTQPAPSDVVRKYVGDIKSLMGRGRSIGEAVDHIRERHPEDAEYIRSAFEYVSGHREFRKWI